MQAKACRAADPAQNGLHELTAKQETRLFGSNKERGIIPIRVETDWPRRPSRRVRWRRWLRPCGPRDTTCDRQFSAAGVERAGRDISACRGAADAGIAMHHQRLGAIPAAHEFDQRADMIVARESVAVHRHADVVHAQNEMVRRYDAAWPFDPVGILEQRDDMARPS